MDAVGKKGKKQAAPAATQRDREGKRCKGALTQNALERGRGQEREVGGREEKQRGDKMH